MQYVPKLNIIFNIYLDFLNFFKLNFIKLTNLNIIM